MLASSAERTEDSVRLDDMPHLPNRPYTFLHAPGDPRWASDSNFSPVVAARVTTASMLLSSAAYTHDDYQRAYLAAAPCLRMGKSLRQEVQVLFLMGCALVGDYAPDTGIQHLSRALEIADVLDEPLACAELAHLMGAVARAHSDY